MDFQTILPEMISIGVILFFGTVLSIGVILYQRKDYYTIKKDIYDALHEEAELHQGDEKNETVGDDRINERDDVEDTDLAEKHKE